MAPPKAWHTLIFAPIGGAEAGVRVSMLACAVVLAGVALWGFRAAAAHERRLADLKPALEEARATAKPAPAPPNGTDFTATLPPQFSAARFVDMLDQAARRSGVALVGVAVTERAPADHALGHQSFELSLHGSYPATKRTLGDVLQPSAGVGRLRMQHDDVAGTVRTQLQVSLWSAAAPAPAAARGP